MLPAESRPGAVSEWQEALPAAGGDATWALSLTRAGGGLPPVGGSRFLQESYATSGLDHSRGSLFGDCVIDWLPYQSNPCEVGFSEPLTLNLSSQSQGSHIWRIGRGGSELLARVILCSATGLPPSPRCGPQCSWPGPVEESALVSLRSSSQTVPGSLVLAGERQSSSVWRSVPLGTGSELSSRPYLDPRRRRTELPVPPGPCRVLHEAPPPGSPPCSPAESPPAWNHPYLALWKGGRRSHPLGRLGRPGLSVCPLPAPHSASPLGHGSLFTE